MTRIILIVVISMFYDTCYGQLNKGNLFFGGFFNAQVYNSKSQFNNNNQLTEYKRSELNIYLNTGIFIVDNLAIGVGPGFYHSTTTDYIYNNDSLQPEYTNNNFSISPFVRYYKKIGGNFSAFANVEVGSISFGRMTNQGIDYQSSFPRLLTNKIHYTSYSIGLNLSPGITYFINNKWGIEATLGYIGYNYTYTKNKNDFENEGMIGRDYEKNNSFNINFNPLHFNLGARYYLNR